MSSIGECTVHEKHERHEKRAVMGSVGTGADAEMRVEACLASIGVYFLSLINMCTKCHENYDTPYFFMNLMVL
jgi:hypothetical protein